MNEQQKSLAVNALRWISIGALAIALLPAVKVATETVANAVADFSNYRHFKSEHAEFEAKHAEWTVARESWWSSLTNEQRAAWSYLHAAEPSAEYQRILDEALEREQREREAGGAEYQRILEEERERERREREESPGFRRIVKRALEREQREREARGWQPGAFDIARRKLGSAPPEPVEPERPTRVLSSHRGSDPGDALLWWYGLPVSAVAWWARRWILLG
ncbi:MAG: hypothetical protein WEF50_23385 [Myxococcota bacterium]